ncbi:hypothetical protein IG631_10077 [Alternaria alternata]|nr:hypothetical protein IG631_10077 [Alternaria alternata]
MQAKQQARKPAAPTVKGAPPPITGPKLGGSKSARAKMHKLQQEELARKKRLCSGAITNDGRVLERWEWRGMDVKKTTWYSK